jgi:carboxymethylenebutenolidase
MNTLNDRLSRPGDGEPLTRRNFTILSAVAGVAAAGCSAGPARAAPVTETDVQVKTTDGTCDAVLTHPAGQGAWPAAVVFPDALGLRPVFRDMAKRLAAEGYAVLTINQFYRSARPPVFTETPTPGDPAFMKRLTELRAPLTADAVMRDATAFIDFLDSQPVVNAKARAGVSGYCMGGPMTFQSAAVRPDRIGAGASFHGAGLVTDKPDSPHLLIPRVRAEFLVAIADNDDKREPDSKTKLKAAFAAAHRTAKVEVYDGAMHGWCVKGSPVYNEAAAERAWEELVALYKRVLV